MNQKERNAWDHFRKYTNGRLLLKRMEGMSSGMADTINENANGVTFWMEVKSLYRWPARVNTQPLRRSFEPGQLPFLREWKCWKGHAFVLLEVDHIYYLLNPDDELEQMRASEIKCNAISFGMESIIQFLMGLGNNEN